MAPPRRALPTRARPRRGSVERPINARLVRGTWLLVALPLLLTAFSVARPEPLPAPTLPPTFDVSVAEQLTRELAAEYPDRSPGSPGGLGAASWVARQLELYGFELQVDRFTARIPGRGKVELRNIVTVVHGASRRTIVVAAHRDNSGERRGANDNASGTGALIELARSFASVGGATRVQAQPAHTLVFVSTDGGAFGALGAARFAESSPYRESVLAVISLDAIAGSGAPRLLIAGDTARSPSAALVRTAALRTLEQSGREPAHDRALRQLLDLGFPFTLGEQGPFVTRGVPAVTLTTLPDEASQGLTDTGFDVQRLAQLGRATQNLIGSLDAGLELAQGTTSYVYLGTRIVRGWALQLVLLTALLPFLIGTVDLFARCRRRRIALVPAARSLRTRLLFWGYVGALVFGAAKLGAFPRGEDRPLPPEASGYEPAPVVLGVLGALLLAGWLVSRERLIPRRPARLEETLAGHTVALLALGLLSLLVVATNPFSLVYLLPSLYAWLWLPQAHASGPLARAALLILGFAGPALLLLSFSTRFGLGAETPWYLLSLVAVGYTPWLAVVLGLVWLGIAAQLAALAAGRYAPYPTDRRQRPGRRLRLVDGETGLRRDALEG
ncbi:MAG: M28 family metallopeptidase [Gaiellaceae bacterium]